MYKSFVIDELQAYQADELKLKAEIRELKSQIEQKNEAIKGLQTKVSKLQKRLKRKPGRGK